MRKIVIALLSVLLITAAGISIYYVNMIKSVGALKVKTNIKAKVYLNGKFLGNTPLCKCEEEDLIKEGIYSLKIVPEDSSFIPFVAKIDIFKDVLTYAERTFLPGALAHAFIITLEKIPIKDPQLLVVSLPDDSLVFLDEKLEGNTPLLIKKLQAGEHELAIQKRGFSKKTLKVQTKPSYKLVVYTYLGAQDSEIQGTETLSPPPLLPVASSAGKIKITDTPTGFLNVREQPALSGTIIMKVYPEEVYSYIEESDGWYKIELPSSQTGWISSAYVQKLTTE